MAIQTIGIGTVADDGTGDSLRSPVIKSMTISMRFTLHLEMVQHYRWRYHGA